MLTEVLILHWIFILKNTKKGKGKAHTLQAIQAQRGLGELRFLDFLTSAPAAFTPRDIPGTHFHEGLSRPQGHGLVGRKYVTENSIDTTGNRSRDRPTSSAAPQPLRYPRPLIKNTGEGNGKGKAIPS
jgi:hypothetical protein